MESLFLFVNNRILVDSETLKNGPGRVHSAQPISNPLNNKTYYGIGPFVIARNPYIRFFSSYQDWKSRFQHAGTANISFAAFLEMYKNKNFGNFPVLLGHIDPISKFCKVEELANINSYSVLRVEEQALWFDSFLQQSGLFEQYKAYLQGGGGKLFAHNFSTTETLLSNVLPAVIGQKPWESTMEEEYSNHHRGSSHKFFQHYTPVIANEVSKLFLDDFRNFQYPLWDGNPSNFRYV